MTQIATIQVKPVAKGDDAFEVKRQQLLDQYPSNVPENLILPSKYLEQPPLDVTNIPRECGLLTPDELAITENYDAVGLAEAIKSRKLSAVAVVTAYSNRAIIAHQLTNCLTEWFMDEAVERAKELDEYQEKTGKTIGPLHGVPISLKEMIALKDHMQSFGFVITVHTADKDAFLVEILRKLGAVFYAKTRQPQGLMSAETASFFGRTLNPYNINLAPGGSSGGEGALLAMKGSVLGVGTDIGGSIRIPSAFSGLYGYKGTSHVLSILGMMDMPFPAGLNLTGIIGPMGRSLRDLNYFVEHVLAEKIYLKDPAATRLSWTGLSTPIASKPLKIGILWEDGVSRPQPPITRALEWAQTRLKDAGFEVTDFVEPDGRQANDLTRELLFPDGGLGFRAALAAASEPAHPMIDEALRPVEHPVANPDKPQGELSANALAEHRYRRDKYRVLFNESWSAQNDPDVIISPAFIGPASAHDTAVYINYTSIFNLLDYPVVVVPTPLKVHKGGEKYSDNLGEPRSDEEAYTRKMWGDGSAFVGAPLGLQVAARRYHDNELFGALALMKDALELA